MNGLDFAQIMTRWARVPRRQREAIYTGLAVVGLVVICLAWNFGSRGHSNSATTPKAIRATFTDAPSWDRPKPAWPRYLADVPAADRVAPSPSPAPAAAAADPVLVPTLPVPPSIVVGPELFSLPPQGVTATKTEPPLPVQNTPAQILASRPASPAPMLAMPLRCEQLPETRPLRSEAMEKIATQADRQIRHGFELANRGAYFAARAEFTAALRLIAQGLDNDRNTTVHSQALSAALTAIKEAQDFIPADGKLEGELDLSPIVASHRTPVLKNVAPGNLQAMRALKSYFTFAQGQLALAAGQEVSGSMALGALGKMHAALAGKPNPEIVAAEAKAIVFFQAAILVCPRNYMAANEMGVLLAHSGDYAGARRALEHSVLLCRCSENLNNLSVVYRQLGEQRLADLAAEKARVAKTDEGARQKNASLLAGGTVAWVDPAALAQSPRAWVDPPTKPAVPAAAGTPTAAGTSPTGPTTLR